MVARKSCHWLNYYDLILWVGLCHFGARTWPRRTFTFACVLVSACPVLPFAAFLTPSSQRRGL